MTLLSIALTYTFPAPTKYPTPKIILDNGMSKYTKTRSFLLLTSTFPIPIVLPQQPLHINTASDRVHGTPKVECMRRKHHIMANSQILFTAKDSCATFLALESRGRSFLRHVIYTLRAWGLYREILYCPHGGSVLEGTCSKNCPDNINSLPPSLLLSSTIFHWVRCDVSIVQIQVTLRNHEYVAS